MTSTSCELYLHNSLGRDQSVVVVESLIISAICRKTFNGGRINDQHAVIIETLLVYVLAVERFMDIVSGTTGLNASLLFGIHPSRGRIAVRIFSEKRKLKIVVVVPIVSNNFIFLYLLIPRNCR